MKKLTVFTLLCFLCWGGTVFGQSTTIAPAFIQIPATATPGSCSAATKGKQYFNTIKNKMFYCDGTAWVEYAVATPVAFMAKNYLNGGINDNVEGLVTTFTEEFDEGNDFTNPGFTAPQDGIYHFDVSFKWGSINATSSYVETSLQKCNGAGNACVKVASGKVNDQPAPVQAFGLDVKLVAGEKMKVSMYQTNLPSHLNRSYETTDARNNIVTYFPAIW